MTATQNPAKRYYRPIISTGHTKPTGALQLAQGWAWFSQVEVLTRDAPPELIHAQDLPDAERAALTAPRPAIAGLSLARPIIMGILNVTPDSFSDGGAFLNPNDALAHAREMAAQGADMIDIGGESTRPGAAYVEVEDEIARTAPVIDAISTQLETPISIDTRKAPVAQAALDAGAALINDVYAFTHDPHLADVAAQASAPVCLMHAQGDPEVMQDQPRYDDVLLDVYDFLEARIHTAMAAGIPRDQILVDPGIGFGKSVDHNLALLGRLSLFHSLGCGILLGASRKRFIGSIADAPDPRDRTAGSIAVALAGVAQGVQFLRVHDIKETKQALALWMAIHASQESDEGV